MIRIVAFDHSEYWNINRPKNCKLLSVYAYDDALSTYCCEITPSRECHYLGTVPTEVPEGEEARERFLDQIMDGDAHSDPVAYYHNSNIDARAFVIGCESDSEEDEEYNGLEKTLEDFRSNQGAYEFEIINLIQEQQ